MHTHHILPRHAGGSDHPWNLVKVPVHVHQDLHYLRWITSGDQQDYEAYCGLSGLMSSDELSLLAMRRGQLNGWAQARKNGACRKGGLAAGYKRSTDFMKNMARLGGDAVKRAVVCVETGEVFSSVTSTGVTNISRAIKYNTIAGGYHWRYKE